MSAILAEFAPYLVLGVVLLGVIGLAVWLARRVGSLDERVDQKGVTDAKRRKVADLLAERRSREQSRAELRRLLDERDSAGGHPSVPGERDSGGTGSKP